VKIRENKTFANYRARAIQLARAYEQFEKSYVTDAQKTRLLTLTKDAGDGLEEKIEANPLEYAELIKLSSDIQTGFALAKEMFLIENDFQNAKTLCEIYYEDCDFEKQKELDYDKLLEFLLEALDGFFQKHVSLIILGIRGKKDSTTETNQNPT